MAKAKRTNAPKFRRDGRIILSSPQRVRNLIARWMTAMLTGEIDRKEYYALLEGARYALESFRIEKELSTETKTITVQFNVPGNQNTGAGSDGTDGSN